MNDTVKIRMSIYKAGQAVQHRGRSERVSHVLLRRGQLFVYLQGHEAPIDPTELTIEPTELVYKKPA